MTNKCTVQNLTCGNCDRSGHVTSVCMGRRQAQSGQGQSWRGRDRRGNDRSRSNSKGRTPQQSRRSSHERNVNVIDEVHADEPNVCVLAQQSSPAAPDVTVVTCSVIDPRAGPLQNMALSVGSDPSSLFDCYANPDTGSNFNVMGSALARSIGAEIRPKSGIQLTAANKQPLAEEGMATVFVRHFGEVYKMTVIVSPDLDRYFIVGRPDLKIMRIIHQNFPAPMQECTAQAQDASAVSSRDFPAADSKIDTAALSGGMENKAINFLYV